MILLNSRYLFFYGLYNCTLFYTKAFKSFSIYKNKTTFAQIIEYLLTNILVLFHFIKLYLFQIKLGHDGFKIHHLNYLENTMGSQIETSTRS